MAKRLDMYATNRNNEQEVCRMTWPGLFLDSSKHRCFYLFLQAPDVIILDVRQQISVKIFF